jgi:SAM-dependent methyltransferase
VDPCHATWADWMERVWAADRPVHVLDVCCGSGLMARELLERGYSITGIDASRAMLTKAHQILGDAVPLVLAELPDLPLRGPYDAVVSTLDGLNYLDPPGLQATFATLAKTLRPGGIFIFDLHTDATLGFLAAHPTIQGVHEDHDFVLRTSIDARWCATSITFHGSGESFTELHTQYVHAAADTRSALQAAGFSDVKVFDEYTDSSLSAESLRATWVARRDGVPRVGFEPTLDGV